jgi:hypothetical protein
MANQPVLVHWPAQHTTSALGISVFLGSVPVIQILGLAKLTSLGISTAQMWYLTSWSLRDVFFPTPLLTPNKFSYNNLFSNANWVPYNSTQF